MKNRDRTYGPGYSCFGGHERWEIFFIASALIIIHLLKQCL